MIPHPDQLRAIAKLRRGDLAEIPFAVLLHALSIQGRSAVLEIERKPLKKEIILENGVPVDCQSNLYHETLGRFMVSRGMLTEEQFQHTVQKSVSVDLPFGETLVLEGLTTATELFKTLQQNLAKKLLDGFTWRSGRFRVLPEPPKVESPLKVKTPQLVLTGISKFALDDEVKAAVGPLVGKKLLLHPSPPYPLKEIHLAAHERQLVRLLSVGKRIDEMAAETSLAFEQIMRLIYALAILQIVVPEEWLPEGAASRPVPFELAPEPTSLSGATAVSAEDVARLHDEVLEAYLKHRKQDAFELFGLEDTATPEEIQEGYLAFSRRFAPWDFATRELASLAEKAEDLFIAGGMAFGELCDVERRNMLIQRRRTLRERTRRPADPDRFAIKSELLDPERQFKKGKALVTAGRYKEAIMLLEFAYDCDPQNSTYRAELAYCRFLERPETEGESAVAELREALRIDPNCALAHFYKGDVHRRLGEFEEAEPLLRTALKMMAPDRRPIEALKALQAQAKRKKSLF